MFLSNIRLKAIPHYINDQSAWFFRAVLGVGKCFLQLKFEQMEAILIINYQTSLYRVCL